jgi:uncharacterized protein with FMN-binding domain
MRRTITILLTVLVLSLPVAEASAAVATTKMKIVVTKKFTGTAFEAGRWGALQVTILVRKTTTITGTKRKVTRKMTALGVPTYPNHTDRSVYINSQALPILKSEALRAQSAAVDMVSGATDTSEAFAQSLQSAILKAKKA